MVSHLWLLLSARRHPDLCVLAEWQSAIGALGTRSRRSTLSRTWLTPAFAPFKHCFRLKPYRCPEFCSAQTDENGKRWPLNVGTTIKRQTTDKTRSRNMGPE